MAVFLAVVMAGCGKHEPEVKPEPEQQDTHRTVLVYMVASNTLGQWHDDASDIAEMKAAVPTALQGGRLLIYHAPYSGAPMLKEVRANANGEAVIDTLKAYPSGTVSVSVSTMQQVLSDAWEAAPARDYGLVLWSHSSGWLQDGIEEPDTRLKSFGIDNGKRMNITSLARALDGAGISWIYFDCCFMGSVESLYELRHTAKQFVASSTEVPEEGMNYTVTLPYLFAPETDLLGAATVNFADYTGRYGHSACPCSEALIIADRLEALAAVTREVYEQAPSALPADYYPQCLATATYKNYYYDFGHYVRALCGADEALFERWQTVYEQAVPYAECTSTIWGSYPVEYFSGLSTFIFKSGYDSGTSNYHTLQWYRDVSSKLESE